MLVLFLIAAPAAAVNAENYRIPYLGLTLNYLGTDAARGADPGYGYQIILGVPSGDQRRALEVTVFDHAYERALDGRENYQTGVMFDYVRDFGPVVAPLTPERQSAARRMKPFVVGGVGFIEEDTFGDKHLHFAAEAGAGLFVPLGPSGWALRLDARAAYQWNRESADGQNGTRAADSLLDFRVMAGLQIPLTAFYDREVPVADAAECEIAVVDPETGRRDCPADRDRDGIEDRFDGCPGTLPGTRVDVRGCPREEGDLDADRVADAADRCPATFPGLRVDRWGCAVAQNLIAHGISFAPESATLTAQTRQFLEELALALAYQPNLRLEIAVHTDAVASEAYNLMLSQRQAEAVRDYLINQGIPAGRLQAVGYGESEPLGPNDSGRDRAANRRVELRFWR